MDAEASLQKAQEALGDVSKKYVVDFKLYYRVIIEQASGEVGVAALGANMEQASGKASVTTSDTNVR
ncbi:hypothetical protein RJT34_12783 [Clitoria ternatea]|uniref:Uncharacterized protein n=1 Tax=Clitoria ternatea TaxID=43366 RepID=A0AAN9JPL7_CLITE